MKILNLFRNWIAKIGTYRIISDYISYEYPAFIVEVRGLLKWHTVKVCVSDDVDYARNCAHELLDMLEEEID